MTEEIRNFEESLPKLTKAPVPVQTHHLKFSERIAKGRAFPYTCNY